jgi:hypothetical protein
VQRAQRPTISANGKDFHIRHSEFVGDVVSTGASFQVYSYPIQPALATTFPWLATLAQRFETYRFQSLRFRYETQTATTSVGTVIMAVDYDAVDDAPTDKVQAMSYKSSVRTAAWDSVAFVAEVADLQRVLNHYTRVATVAATDLKTYDVGNLHVCLQGVAAATVGELYVDYDLALFTPQLSDQVGGHVHAAGGLDADDLWGTVAFVPVGPLPFEWTSAAEVTFTQNWEGLIGSQVTMAACIAALTDTGSATVTVVSSIWNAAQTVLTSVLAVQALRGQTLNLHSTGGGAVSAAVYWVASADYRNL